MRTRARNKYLSSGPAVVVALAASMASGANGAVIGVLADGRQVEYLSLLGTSSAEARVTLEQDGHAIAVLPSLGLPMLDLVDIVWLPLLHTSESYSAQERLDLLQYTLDGGRVIWIGDADVYNGGDDSFLAIFGAAKLPGNLDTAVSPAAGEADHPVLSGPHGAIASVAANAGYGLFDGPLEIAGVFTGPNEEVPPQIGTFSGFLSPASGFAGAGRAVLVCDASIFGQALDQAGQDHRALLRNMVKWAEAAPSYTPKGIQVETGGLDSDCGACGSVDLVFEEVSATGETALSAIGSGRCGFNGLDPAVIPAGFLGFGFEVETTAVLPAINTIEVGVAYDEAALAALGVDEATLRLFWHDAVNATVTDVTGILDTTTNHISGSVPALGAFLLGAIDPAQDCNANGIPDACDVDPSDPDGNGSTSSDCNGNGIPDACEIHENSTAPGGPFFCQTDCLPDCNGNGVPDSCDFEEGASLDCNENGIPDECDVDPSDPDGDGQTVEDCNGNGVPDPCDLDSGTSQDCNGNTLPDECENEPDIVPEITQQPQDQAQCSGGSVSFTVLAGGAGPLTYQWLKDGTQIPGAIEDHHTIGQVSVEDAGIYTVSVANTCGSVTSDPAALAVEDGPSLTLNPLDVAVCEGDQAVFAVTAVGTEPLSYQWMKDGEPLVDGGPITGAATPTLQIEPCGPLHSGAYTCMVSDECGATSSTQAVLVVDLPAQVVGDPADAFACDGGSATFTVLAAGAGLAYQWQFDGGDGFLDLTDGSNIGGSTGETITISGATEAAAGHYRCVITGACGLPTMTTPATLAIGSDIHVDSSPSDQFGCAGDTAVFHVTASGTDATYQWQREGESGFVDLQDGGDLIGVETDTLAISNLTGQHHGLYRCVVAGACGQPAASGEAVLTVGSSAHIENQPSDQWACPGGAASFAIAAGGTGLTYQWQFDDESGFSDLTDGDNTSGATTGALTLSGLSELASGQYRCVVSSACGQPAASASASLEVGAPVAIGAGPSDVLACPGDDVEFAVVADGSSPAYQWQRGDGATFQDLTDSQGVTGATSDILAISSVGTPQQGLYRCIVSGPCGPAATSDTALLTVAVGACDCNENGSPDSEDIAAGISEDCNGDGVPDDCALENGTNPDCNTNGTPDDCDLAEGDADDCNANNIPDDCDITDGTSQDCNTDQLPDDCQLIDNDCNGNGIPDECDVPFVADAGEPMSVCTGQVSVPLGGAPVASGSTPPYTFLWQVVSGPVGGGTVLDPEAEHPRFVAEIEGMYEIEVVVGDSSQPPCQVVDAVQLSATMLSLDAGMTFAMCAGGTSAEVSPTVAGGIEPYSYLWAVEEESADTSTDQFTGEGPHAAGPTFTPEVSGRYVLRLTVMDSNEPACIATDTLVVNVMELAIASGQRVTMCLGAESDPLGVSVTSVGSEPLSYSWSIADSSPSLDLSQFTGAGPESPNPTFLPDAAGDYELTVVVRDSSTPPCEQAATVWVSVGTMTVRAGGDAALCVGSRGLRLAPTVEGGVGDLVHVWSIEPGSPSHEEGQFADPHHIAPDPIFTPAAPGLYTLRLTVTDSASPPCVATDTVLIHATSLSVDAGEDFTTHVFRPSRLLGAVPVASGVDGPFVYEWSILAGPTLGPSQLSSTEVEHPVFTPAAVGTYNLVVTAQQSDGSGCAVTDAVAVEAIASTLALLVNAEGRLFMTLQIDEPHTRGRIRISDGRPGAKVTGSIHDDGPSGDFDGFPSGGTLSRHIQAGSEMPSGSYLAVVVMDYHDGEVMGLDETSLRCCRLVDGAGSWRLAGSGVAEQGPFPARPSPADLGRHGVDTTQNYAWAVVNHLGEFAAGIPSGEAPDGMNGSGSSVGAPVPGAPSDLQAFPELLSLCGGAGTCGAGTAMFLALGCLSGVTRIRHWRGKGRSPGGAPIRPSSRDPLR